MLYENMRQLIAAGHIGQYIKAPVSICLAAGATFFSQASLWFWPKPVISLDIRMSLCSSALYSYHGWYVSEVFPWSTLAPSTHHSGNPEVQFPPHSCFNLKQTNTLKRESLNRSGNTAELARGATPAWSGHGVVWRVCAGGAADWGD